MALLLFCFNRFYFPLLSFTHNRSAGFPWLSLRIYISLFQVLLLLMFLELILIVVFIIILHIVINVYERLESFPLAVQTVIKCFRASKSQVTIVHKLYVELILIADIRATIYN